MRKLLAGFGLLTVLLASAGPASAQLQFLQDIFGARKHQQGKEPWWTRRRPPNRDDVHVFADGYKSRKGAAVRKIKPVPSYSDPEGDQGFGMGNLVYEPLRQVRLFDKSLVSLAMPVGADPNILAALGDENTVIKIEAGWDKPIIDLYRSRGFKPIWIVDGKLDPRAENLLAFAASVSVDGMDPQIYLPVGLASYDDIVGQLNNDPAQLARFDLAMTAAMLRLAEHISGGRLEPNRLSKYNDLPSQRIAPATALRVMAYSPFPDAYLASLQPRHPAYAAMKAELAHLRVSSSGAEASLIPEGATVKLGGKDARLAQVRDRLHSLGFADPQEPSVDAEFATELDPQLSDMLKTFQNSTGLKQTGALNNQTVQKLNGTNRASDIERLVINMERLRWLPRDFGSRHIFVNQPAYEVVVMDKGSIAWRSNVIIGRPMTQTASFYDEMETVVFNPSWGVPQSIIVNEYLPKLRRDPGYLDRQGFKVINQNGKVVSSRTINWGAYSQKRPLGVQQPAGNDNALGELKFLFPNSHSIYMHDTPTRHLFAEKIRAFSHGCVRVQDPREFAHVLLGWNRSKIDDAVDSRQSQSVALDKKIPIFIGYFTAWPDSKGNMQYYVDVYQRDAAMHQALYSKPLKQASSMTRTIVPN